jgi:succinate dehydrogenase/fumarate reductase-like Fe-S protein
VPEPVAGRRDRASALSRLALAYARHQVRRWSGRGSRDGASAAERLYRPEHYLPLTAEEREQMPAMSRCINCGICALVAGRSGAAYLPDLASAYLRPLPLLPRVREDLEPTGDRPEADLEAAAAACPVGVPLPEVAAMLRRLAAS